MIYALQVELSSKAIESIRKSIAEQNSVFSEKKYLDSLYVPSNIVGRKEQAVQIIKHIESLRQGLVVPVISVYGSSGTGKSAVVRFVCQNLQDITSFCFVNLRKSKTIFGSVNVILSNLGSPQLKSADGLNKAIEQIGNKIEEILASEQKKFFVLVLDEYDVIFYDKRGNPSDFMYKLLTLEETLREKGLWLCMITISNNTLADYNFDDRVKSRIGTSEVFFSQYNADDIFSILHERAYRAFLKKPNDKVIQYCSKICSENRGDARRALDMLRVAGELSNGVSLTKDDIDKANDQLQKDRVSALVANASHHQKMVIAAICANTITSENGWTSTSSVYDRYKQFISSDFKPLSYRRVYDLLIEIENSGLVVSRTISRGRYGFGREYRLVIAPKLVGPLISKDWWEKTKSEFNSLYDFEYGGLYSKARRENT